MELLQWDAMSFLATYDTKLPVNAWNIFDEYRFCVCLVGNNHASVYSGKQSAWNKNNVSNVTVKCDNLQVNI